MRVTIKGTDQFGKKVSEVVDVTPNVGKRLVWQLIKKVKKKAPKVEKAKRDLSLSMGISHHVDRDDVCEPKCPACKVLKLMDNNAKRVKKLRDFVAHIEFQLNGRTNGIDSKYAQQLSDQASKVLCRHKGKEPR